MKSPAHRASFTDTSDYSNLGNLGSPLHGLMLAMTLTRAGLVWSRRHLLTLSTARAELFVLFRYDPVRVTERRTQELDLRQDGERRSAHCG